MAGLSLYNNKTVFQWDLDSSRAEQRYTTELGKCSQTLQTEEIVRQLGFRSTSTPSLSLQHWQGM
jgi:hypothetical protein